MSWLKWMAIIVYVGVGIVAGAAYNEWGIRCHGQRQDSGPVWAYDVLVSAAIGTPTLFVIAAQQIGINLVGGGDTDSCGKPK